MRTILTATALLLTGLVIGQRENTREQDSIAATGRCVFINENDPFPNMIAFKINGEEVEGADVSYIHGEFFQIKSKLIGYLSNFNKSFDDSDSTVLNIYDGNLYKYWTLDRADDDYYFVLVLCSSPGHGTITTMIYEKEEE